MPICQCPSPEVLKNLLDLKELPKGVRRTPRFLKFLSSLIEYSVQKNEMLLETEQIEDVLTVFHGSRAPPVSIQQYVDRIFKYASCSPSCFIVAYIYMDRYLQQTEAYLTSLNVHRLLVTSLMVAAKFMDDSFFNNAYYAKVGGVSTSEMNKLEMKLLFSIDFRLQVDAETFRKYCLKLEKEAGELIDPSRLVGSKKLGQDTATLCAILDTLDDRFGSVQLYH